MYVGSIISFSAHNLVVGWSNPSEEYVQIKVDQLGGPNSTNHRETTAYRGHYMKPTQTMHVFKGEIPQIYHRLPPKPCNLMISGLVVCVDGLNAASGGFWKNHPLVLLQWGNNQWGLQPRRTTKASPQKFITWYSKQPSFIACFNWMMNQIITMEKCLELTISIH